MLIVLDVNGLLCYKKNHDKTFEEMGLNSEISNFEKIKCDRYDFYIRPDARKFIDELLKKNEVGIFSSTTHKNVKPVLDHLFTKDELENNILKFVWCRDRSKLDPDYNQDNKMISRDVNTMISVELAAEFSKFS